jgi:exodeoxyribonuclease VII large subunit
VKGWIKLAIIRQSERPLLTVTQVNEYIKGILDKNQILSDLCVKGEISNYTHSKSGHRYFTIKDENSNLKAVLFSSAAAKLKFAPENGMKIIAVGRVSSFIRDGSYQFYVNSLEPDGIGSLAIAFEQLKQKLSAEGLFDPNRKKKIPPIPRCIGVVTSPTGAVIRDIINVTSRRFPYAKILLYPSAVQGSEAVEQLIAGVRWFSENQAADVLIIGRGGGSTEDLWAFNNEDLAREIAACSIPTISAVGHEVDFTICDFVADLRAPTPSAAAELAVPDTNELIQKMNHVTKRMETLLSGKLSAYRKDLQLLQDAHVMQSPLNLLDERRMILESDMQALEHAAQSLYEQKKSEFIRYAAKLEALNPLAVLTRGYAAVFKKDKELVKSVEDIQLDEELLFRIADGSFHGVVTQKNKEV